MDGNPFRSSAGFGAKATAREWKESVENRFMIIKAQLDQVLVGKRKVTERQGFDPKMQQMDGEKLLHYLWTVKCLRIKFPVS